MGHEGGRRAPFQETEGEIIGSVDSFLHLLSVNLSPGGIPQNAEDRISQLGVCGGGPCGRDTLPRHPWLCHLQAPQKPLPEVWGPPRAGQYNVHSLCEW